MESQKSGLLAVKDKDTTQRTIQQLRKPPVSERPDSFQSIGQDPTKAAQSAELSLLETKPYLSSENTYIASPKSKLVSRKLNHRSHSKKEKRPKYGMEVVLDLHDCDPKVIRSSRLLKSFAIKLCKLIKMKRYGKALTPHFGHSDPKTSGYSLLQFLETSSITGHFSDHWNSAYINVFSCKMFSAKKTVDFSKNYFKAKRVVARTLIRP